MNFWSTFVPAGIALARSTSVAPGRRFPVQRVELPLLSVNRRNHLPLPLPAAFRRRVRATPCNAACMHVVYTRSAGASLRGAANRRCLATVARGKLADALQ